jgi:glycosyltransferase involved in cell wall biosynthesis
MIARLIRDKGIIEYVEAAAAFRERYRDIDAEFCLLGNYYEGNPTAVNKEEVTAWEKEGIIRYLGTSDDVPAVIEESDCVVLPSYREGISQVLLEAASMAKPIIATDVPGCREVVDDTVNGYLCEVKDAISLYDAMARMAMLTHTEREEMGRRGREKMIMQFDEKVVNTQYLACVERLLGLNDR